AQRHYPAAQRLAEAKNVGHDVPVLTGENPPSAAHAGLHFVENQKNLVLIAQRPDARQIVVGRYDGTGFALNGFQNDRGDVFAEVRELLEFALEILGITVVYEKYIRQQRL